MKGMCCVCVCGSVYMLAWSVRLWAELSECVGCGIYVCRCEGVGP